MKIIALELFRKNNELSNLDIKNWMRCRDRIIFECQALGACSRVVVPCTPPPLARLGGTHFSHPLGGGATLLPL